MPEALGITSGDRYLHTASFAFSSSMRQFLLPLSCGATVVLATTDEIRDPLALFELDPGTRVSRSSTSCRRTCGLRRSVLARHGGRRPSGAARQPTCDSSCPPANRCTPTCRSNGRASFGHRARLVNMYGQTETTGIVTVYPDHVAGRWRRAAPCRSAAPSPNTRVYVLDAAREPVPPGVPGEVFIGGPGVGRGYLDQPRPRPNGSCRIRSARTPAARLYRTGDLARIRPDGNLEFLGRVDQQVKVRGFRIEPGEIEAALNAHPQVLASARRGAGRRRRWQEARGLRGATHRGRRPAPDAAAGQSFAKALRDFLKGKLPDYMAPCGHRGACGAAADAEREGGPEGAAARWTGRPAESQEPFVAPRPRRPRRSWRRSGRTCCGWIASASTTTSSISAATRSSACEMIERANRAGLQLSPPQLFQHQTIAELVRAAVPQAVTPEPLRAVRLEQPEAMRPGGPPPGAATDASAPAVRVTLESMRAYGREALRAGRPVAGRCRGRDRSADRGQPARPADAQRRRHPPLCPAHRLGRDRIRGRASASSARRRRAPSSTATTARASGRRRGDGAGDPQGADGRRGHRRRAPLQSLRRRGPLRLAGRPGEPDRPVHDQRRALAGANRRRDADCSATTRWASGIPAARHHPIVLDIVDERHGARQDRAAPRRGQAAAAGLDPRPPRASLHRSGGSRRGPRRADRGPQGLRPRPRAWRCWPAS